MKGTLRIERTTKDGKPALRFLVRGNVGPENRPKLDALGMTPEVDISNSREKYVTDQAEALALRTALIEQGII